MFRRYKLILKNQRAIMRALVWVLKDKGKPMPSTVVGNLLDGMLEIDKEL